MSALGAAATWTMLASVLGLPVSATHSIVGGIVGMAVALKGFQCVNWGMRGVAKIALSWVTSPLLASIAAFIIYALIMKIIYRSKASFERALWATPLLLSFSFIFLEILIVWDRIYLNLWIKLVIIALSFAVIFVITTFLGRPYLRNAINKAYMPGPPNDEEIEMDVQNAPNAIEDANSRIQNTTQEAYFQDEKEESDTEGRRGGKDETKFSEISTHNDSEESLEAIDEDSTSIALDQNELYSISELQKDIVSDDEEKATQVFWYLQNVSACLGAFAHGANDTANMIGPFAAIYYLWRHEKFISSENVPLWMVAIGGASIVLGLAILGYRVIQTMGKEIIIVDFPRGFSSELSSSMTVVLASRLQIPVSSTHCQVGAIIGVGLVQGLEEPKAKMDLIGQENSPENAQLDAHASDSNLQNPKIHDLSSASSSDILHDDQHSESGREILPSKRSSAPSLPQTISNVEEIHTNDRIKSLLHNIKRRIQHVSWKAVGKIFLSWIVTLPVSALLAALFATILKYTIKK